MLTRVKIGDVAFILVVMAFAGWMIWSTRGWVFRASLFPLVAAWTVFALCGLELVRMAIRAKRDVPRPDATEDQADGDVPAAQVGAFTAWIMAYLIVFWLLGFAVGGTVMTIAYLVIEGRERWLTLALMGGGTAAFFWVATAVVHIPLPRGVLLRMVLG